MSFSRRARRQQRHDRERHVIDTQRALHEFCSQNFHRQSAALGSDGEAATDIIFALANELGGMLGCIGCDEALLGTALDAVRGAYADKLGERHNVVSQGGEA